MDAIESGNSTRCRKRYNVNTIFYMTLVVASLVKSALSFHDCKFMVKVGSTYTLQCSSNLTSAHNLVLRRYNSGIIPQQEYRIIDNHTIEYKWENIPRVSTHIECNFRDQNGVIRGIFVKDVVAESEPEEVTNFKCVSYDFQYIRCDFHKPAQNYTLTEIKPSDDEVTPKVNYFTLSQPKYNPEKQHVYNFTVNSKNCFADRTQVFSFNHLDNVIPGKPNVSLSNRKPNRVILRLTMHDKLYMEKGLIYEVKIKNAFSGAEMYLNTSHLNSKSIQHTITVNNLHAFKSYTMQVRTRSVGSDDTPEMWSSPTLVNFTTLSKPPDFPPRVDSGGFRVGPDGSIHIYWELLPEADHNGDNFTYEIWIVRKENFENEVVKKIISSGFTVKLDVPLADYDIRIQSVNSDGSSPQANLRFPKTLLPPPRRLRSIYDKEVYHLSWEAPNTELSVESYTVFHCVFKHSLQEDVTCNENFTFSRVEANVHSIQFTNANQFAVSANYANGSSGMIWISCTAHKGSDIGDVEIISSKAVNSTTIHLKWKLTCNQITLLRTLIVKYCLKNSSLCTNKTLHYIVEDVSLSNLLPNSEYQIQVALISEDFTGPYSQITEKATLEAAPSAPKNLTACQVTKDSIALVWNRPERLNGRLRYYKISCNDKLIELTDEIYLRANEISYNLTNLKSYNVYDIFVIAATISESVASNGVHVRTAAKEPPMLLYSHIETLNYGHVKISWKQDTNLRSLISIYEIKYENDVDDDTQGILLPNITDFIIENLNCSGNTKYYKFSIRTINVAVEYQYDKCFQQNSVPVEIVSSIEALKRFNDSIISFKSIFQNSLKKISPENNLTIKFLHAPWSEPLLYDCHIFRLSYAVTLFCFPITLLALVLMLTLACYLRRRYLIAKDINIILPDGVAVINKGTTSAQESNYHSNPDCEPESRSLMHTEQSSPCSTDEGYHSSQLCSMTLDDLCQNEDKTLTLSSQSLTVIAEIEADHPERQLCSKFKSYYYQPTSPELNIDVPQSSEVLDNSHKMAPVRPEMFDANGYVINSAASKLLFKTTQYTMKG